jgi:hypothetical protein
MAMRAMSFEGWASEVYLHRDGGLLVSVEQRQSTGSFIILSPCVVKTTALLGSNTLKSPRLVSLTLSPAPAP